MKAELINGSEDGRIIEIEEVVPKIILPYKRTNGIWVEDKNGGYWDKFGKMIYVLETLHPYPRYKLQSVE